MTVPLPPPDMEVDALLRRALAEDLGRAGDITSASTIPAGHRSVGHVVARRAGRLAGLTVSTSAFTLLDPEVEVRLLAGDGDDAMAGQRLAEIAGSTRSLLAAERTCLNLLGHL